jgi:hypothetical protein
MRLEPRNGLAIMRRSCSNSGRNKKAALRRPKSREETPKEGKQQVLHRQI